MANHRPALSRRDQEKLRLKIDAGRVLSMMQCFVTGDEYNFGGVKGKAKVEWTNVQFKAAQLLIDKALPGLTNVAVPDDGETQKEVISDKPVDSSVWAKQHRPDNVVSMKDASD